MILCSNPLAQYQTYQKEIEEALIRVARKGWYILGDEVIQFEKEFAAYCGVNYGVGVADGTDAIHLALRAAGISEGDEVITVSNTAVATVVGIEMAGAIPVLIDIDPITYTIDVEKAARAITPATKALLPVHLFGHPANLDGLRKLADQHGLILIEDCAQAHGATWKGAKVGSCGDLACFSFYPTKNLGALGDGGMVVTKSEKWNKALRELREYGWSERYICSQRGCNSRLDEIQAAVLRIKLRHLDEDIGKRRSLAALYQQELSGTTLVLPFIGEAMEHAFHLYVVRSEERDALKTALAKKEIGCLIHYPVPIHQQPAYDGKIRLGSDLPVTEKMSSKILSLPMYPELKQEQVKQICHEIRSYLQTRH